MLNRRIIRGKVLQQIFAYKTCQAANAELAKEAIVQLFAPDLNSMEAQDTKKLEGLAKLTLVVFEEYVKTGQSTQSEGLPDECKSAYNKAITLYQESNRKDKERIAKKLVADSEALMQQYILCLLLLDALASALKTIKKIDGLRSYRALDFLINHSEIQAIALRNHLSWNQDQDIVCDIMNMLLENEEATNMIKQKPQDIETQKKNLSWLVKQTIFKNTAFHDFFESKNLQWHEDKVAVKDMVVDTIQSIQEDGSLQLATISKNWEDDREFMVSLFDTIITHEKEFEAYLAPKLQNWDISRITLTDNVLMKMCIGEILFFPSIPVKVSLNEYIEISKKFSTPKSKLLINGVLDALAIELQKQGKIKKSGRGLIDNK